MATQLHCCPECRATKFHHPVAEFCRTLMSILVLISLYGTRFCNGLPLEPFGYVSIDCGGVGGYNDNFTGLAWVGENDYLESYHDLRSANLTSSIVLMQDSNSTIRDNVKQLETARIFNFSSAFTRYCYNFNLSLSNKNSTVYLVRAMFPSLLSVSDSEQPRIVVDTSYLEVPYRPEPSYEPLTIELLATASDDSMNVCLTPDNARFTDTGIVAISSLELRSVPETLYPVLIHGKVDADGRVVQDTFNYYVTQARLNFGGDESSPGIRYPSDKYDRLWYAAPRGDRQSRNIPVSSIYGLDKFNVKSIKGSTVPNISPEDDLFQVPLAVSTSALEGVDSTSNISFQLDNLYYYGSTYCLSIVLFDVDADENRSRIVNIYNQDYNYFSQNYSGPWQWILQDSEVPKTQTNIWSDRAFKFIGSPDTTFEILPAANSARPVMVNALELYAVVENVPLKTNPWDVSKVQILRDKLPVSGKSFGDPCLPVPWEWIKCDLELRVIVEINLGSWGLQGSLGEDFKFPWVLTVLDLSNNRLNGTLPRSLGISSFNGAAKM
ncbi:hypothetical protein R1sor_025598 [Riccia sorocarpa]|uniref:Malectin-like domain-containing protein n=1 Tax=Riccia sorocarpa TaxID=122646 RepID=A0ABD3GC44_9MARC